MCHANIRVTEFSGNSENVPKRAMCSATLPQSLPIWESTTPPALFRIQKLGVSVLAFWHL